jgi:hypothetical protein
MFYTLPDEEISQSLPDLRRRAYALCSAEHTWAGKSLLCCPRQAVHSTPRVRGDLEAKLGRTLQPFAMINALHRSSMWKKPWNLLRTRMLSIKQSHGVIRSCGNLICQPTVIFLLVTIFWMAEQLLPLMRRYCWVNVNTTIQRGKCEGAWMLYKLR